MYRSICRTVLGPKLTQLTSTGNLDPHRFQCGSGFEVLMTKKAKTVKFYSLKENPYFFYKKCVIPRPPRRASKLQERPSAINREHQALHNFKFLNFFLFLWVIYHFCPPSLQPKKITMRSQIHNTETGQESYTGNWLPVHTVFIKGLEGGVNTAFCLLYRTRMRKPVQSVPVSCAFILCKLCRYLTVKCSVHRRIVYREKKDFSG
jgi:hypothetical protein